MEELEPVEELELEEPGLEEPTEPEELDCYYDAGGGDGSTTGRRPPPVTRTSSGGRRPPRVTRSWRRWKQQRRGRSRSCEQGS